jgi:secondary thiamine-phosphate synthase enzyme
LKVLSVDTSAKNQFVDITKNVIDFVAQEKIEDGLILVYVPHTTAGVTVNEGADPAVAQDVQSQLSDIAPANGGYRHAEGNSDGHIKSTIVGSSAVIPVSGGKLALGTWQAVFFCEFDGPRQRKYYLAAAK